jgi:DNA-binding transcriptional regulator LsrR (DeoR family)
MASSLDAEQLRMISRVAKLYYSKQLRQTQIAKELGVSQARVSRLLAAADDLGIVKTTVIAPGGLFPDLEMQLEEQLGLLQVHVVSPATETSNLTQDLGRAAASLIEAMPLEGKNIGFTAWSRSLRSLAREFNRFLKMAPENVVELLGDVGSPLVQHEATLATEIFARALGGKPVFLRLPSVVSNSLLAESLIQNDPHARQAISLMNRLDLALVGVGSCDIASPNYAGANFFSQEQLAIPISRGAVGQINLRFIDQSGNPVDSPLDSLVIGITLEQLARTPIRIAVAAGVDKLSALRAAAKGGWINVLVTDLSTAEQLLASNAEPILVQAAAR